MMDSYRALPPANGPMPWPTRRHLFRGHGGEHRETAPIHQFGPIHPHISAHFSFYSSRLHASEGDDDLSSVAVSNSAQDLTHLSQGNSFFFFAIKLAQAIVASQTIFGETTIIIACWYWFSSIQASTLHPSLLCVVPELADQSSAKSAYAFPPPRYFYFWSAKLPQWPAVEGDVPTDPRHRRENPPLRSRLLPLRPTRFDVHRWTNSNSSRWPISQAILDVGSRPEPVWT